MVQGVRGSMRLQILGPLRLWRDGTELDAGPPQQRRLLAALLVSAGRRVTTSELINLIWDDNAPASALNIIQKYVSELRRILEPSLPARGSGSYLRRHGGGYVFDAAPGVLDLIDFRELVGRARESAGADALDCYTEALGLWQGPAGDGLTTNPAFAGLDREFFDACVAATEIAVARHQPERLLTYLRLAASMAPLHEPVPASLILALAASGQQAEALSVFEAVRARLAAELGVLPGPALRTTHHRVLRPDRDTKMTTDGLVGRVDEARIVRQSWESAFSGGIGLVLVEGEPGVGKTRLLEETTKPADRDVLVVWGRCLEGDGAPSMWPWVQVITTLLGSCLRWYGRKGSRANRAASCSRATVCPAAR